MESRQRRFSSRSRTNGPTGLGLSVEVGMGPSTLEMKNNRSYTQQDKLMNIFTQRAIFTIISMAGMILAPAINALAGKDLQPQLPAHLRKGQARHVVPISDPSALAPRD